MFVDIGTLSYRVREFGDTNSSIVLIALHGFTGSGQVYEQFSCEFKTHKIRLLAVDLPGHGDTITPNSPEIHNFDTQISSFEKLIDRLNISTCHLLGYSMGGRIALHYALKKPTKLRSLILESTNNGISDKFDRLDRSKRDEYLSEQITHNYLDFLVKWNRLPLFHSPHKAQSTQKELFNMIQAEQNPTQMALSMREFSPGKIPNVYDELSSISCPVLAITGNMDKKYSTLWRSLIKNLHNGVHKNIENAGHRVHLDQPNMYIETILNFIKSTIK